MAYEQNSVGNNVVMNTGEDGGLPWKIFLLALVLFGTVVAGYIGLRLGYRPYLNSKIASVDKEIATLSESVSADEQKRLLQFYGQISNLKTLLSSHVNMNNLLTFIEDRTNKKVYYESFGWNTKSRTLALDGIAESYRVLAQQLESIKQSNNVADYTATQSNTVDNRVRFHIEIVFTDAFLK